MRVDSRIAEASVVGSIRGLNGLSDFDHQTEHQHLKPDEYWPSDSCDRYGKVALAYGVYNPLWHLLDARKLV
jgi:hypothetical protein